MFAHLTSWIKSYYKNILPWNYGEGSNTSRIKHHHNYVYICLIISSSFVANLIRLNKLVLMTILVTERSEVACESYLITATRTNIDKHKFHSNKHGFQPIVDSLLLDKQFRFAQLLAYYFGSIISDQLFLNNSC